MNATFHRHRHFRQGRGREGAARPPLPQGRGSNRPPWRRLAALVLLGVGLLVCHGCHNHDVDDELAAFLLRGRREARSLADGGGGR